MNILLQILFYISILILLHIYVLYPAIIIMISKFKSLKEDTSSEYLPSVSIIISAFNEEKVIEKTVRNFLMCDYPKEKIEIIIGSDKSTDRTDEIVESLVGEFNNIKYFPFEQRRGKGPVLNDIVNKATNEILILSDANTIYSRDSIKIMTRFYSNSSIGGVSGRLVLEDFEDSINSGTQETLYWNLEYYIKKAEGSLGMLIGANGGIYSIRRALYVPIPTEYPVMDDFFIALKILEQHKKMVFATEAKAFENTAPTIQSEFKRKVRNNSIDLSTIQGIKKLLSPSFGLIAFALWSHKIFRWLSPIFLILALITSGVLSLVEPYFLSIFLLQILIYLLGPIGYLLLKIKIRIKFLLILYYFIITNLAMLIGLIKFISGTHSSHWQSTAR